jgi:hypothetical protein
MFKVEFLNDRGDWIHSSFHKNQENADISAEEMEDKGYQTRVLYCGKIVRESREGL